MSRMSRSIRVAPECIPTVKQALRRHGFPSQNALAIELGRARATITRFFNGKPVDYINFVEISDRLGLDWHAIAYIEKDTPIEIESSSPSDPSPEQEPEKKGLGIDWRQVCREMLDAQNQRRLTTNPLTAGDGVAFELDEIYVPLGLVERKQRDRRSSDVSPEQGSRIYEPEASDEIIKTFQQDEFFEQVLQQGRSRRIAIIGEPGAGKTTLLQKIAAWVLDNTEDVPIWISLADLHRKSLKEYLLSDWLENATRTVQVSQEMQKALGELFNSRRVWLLLDAVDEMAMGAQSLAPLQLIANQIAGWVADAKVVLTCRLNVWDAGKNALEAFETYRNLDFSYGDAQTPDQVGQFIRRWFKENPELAERLRAELDQPGRERIKDAVKNPLRLALLCRAWRLGQGELPNTKAGLYQQFTEALYEWKQDRFPTTSTQQQKLNRVLGELAKRALSQEKTKFRLRHHLVCSVLGKPDEELFQLALQLGWLNQVGVAIELENRGEKVYAFYHPTFQEYFAAQAIDDWHFFLNHISHDPAQGTYRIFESQWNEVILLWLGRENVLKQQKNAFIKALLMFKDVGKIFYSYRAFFLAAAGMAELRDCSWADLIVAQLIKWGFGYFDMNKQVWQTFVEPDAKAARAALLQTDRTRAIAALVELLQTSQEHEMCWEAFEDLAKISPGNPEAIAVLVQLIELAKNEYTRKQAFYSLGKIGSGNPEAVTALVQLIELTENEYICGQAADILGKIDPGNPKMVATLVQLIESNQDESVRRRAVESLGKIGLGNQVAIVALVQLIKSTDNESIHWQAVNSLGKIGLGNQAAITVLVQLIKSTENESTHWQAVNSLGKIGLGNQAAITVLVQLIESTDNESTHWYAANSLGKIGLGNQTAIAALVQLLQSTQNESVRRRAAESLGEIGLGNQTAIEALMQLLQSTQNEFTRWQVAESLGKIDFGNQTAIEALMQLLQLAENESSCWQIANSLGKIDSGNSTAIAVLVQLIKSAKNETILGRAADSLEEILPNEQLPAIVTSLKDYLSTETYEYDIERFRLCYKVIWHCAQNMSYPAFYKVWYNQPIPSSSEVLDLPAVGSPPITQSLNLAELPQTLATAIANDLALSQAIHLICIDCSKFIDRDNPAAKIYTEMVRSGCPKCEDGTPKTMQELQTYWDLLDTDKGVVLVFYQDKGFSETFLDALSKFDGAICVITAQPLNDIPLQCFNPNQAIADVVDWLKKVALEA
jgi:HEAT repeat protein/energy-coupling factor transporter ATP-binding protein EcfA2